MDGVLDIVRSPQDGDSRFTSSLIDLAMGRQPEAIGKIQTAMIIGAAFIEALTIYVFVSLFVFQGKL